MRTKASTLKREIVEAYDHPIHCEHCERQIREGDEILYADGSQSYFCSDKCFESHKPKPKTKKAEITTMDELENKERSVVVFDNNGATAPMKIQELKEQLSLVKEVVSSMMKDGQHYGKIPGCGPKPALLKPGAEMLCTLFRLRPDLDVKREDFPGGHREYTVIVTLKDAAGNFRGQGVGSCSTMERKYRYVKGSENPNIADTYNTCLKMAKKRGLVDAMLTNAAASEFFTQDIDDDPDLYRRSGGGDAEPYDWAYEIPFKDTAARDFAKQNGARWNKGNKTWDAPNEIPKLKKYCVMMPGDATEADDDDIPENWTAKKDKDEEDPI